MTFGQKYNLDKVKRKMIFEKTVFYDILYLTYIIHSCAVKVAESHIVTVFKPLIAFHLISE